MKELNIEQIKELGRVLNSLSRVKILNICHKAHNITDVTRKMGLSYKTVYNHIKMLEDAKLVKTEVKIDEKGKNVMVQSLISIQNGKIKKNNLNK